MIAGTGNYSQTAVDLSRIKTKVAGPLTKRQLICFSCAAVLGLPLYFLTKKELGNDVAALLMVTVMIPCFLIAFYERDGFPAEKVLLHYIKWRRSPKYRPYRSQNILMMMGRLYSDREEIEELEFKRRHGNKDCREKQRGKAEVKHTGETVRDKVKEPHKN